MKPDAPHLVVLFGPLRGVVRLMDTRLSIGRGAENSLQLLDEAVSRDHCCLESRDSEVWLRDLHSRNGTFINGERVDVTQKLRKGDLLSVGSSVLAFAPNFSVHRGLDGESTLVLSGITSNRKSSKEDVAPEPDEVLPQFLERVAKLLGADGQCAWIERRHGQWKVTKSVPSGAAVFLDEPALQKAWELGQTQTFSTQSLMENRQEKTTFTRTRMMGSALVPSVVLGKTRGCVWVSLPNALPVALLEHIKAFVSDEGAKLALAELESRPQQTVSEARAPVAASSAMKEALSLAERAARVSSNVLILGETGTGKEEVARYIHANGFRQRGPFVTLNCGGIPSELAESALFGHEKGSFTGAVSTQIGAFEQADGGTLFLDELGELPLAVQVKALRVIQDRMVQRLGGTKLFPVDVRLISATHRNLEKMVAEGQFREDLFWRVNVVRIELKPLRDRPEDVLALADEWLPRLSRRLGIETPQLEPSARQALTEARWPGNVRQLINHLERVLVLRRHRGSISRSELDLPLDSKLERLEFETLEERVQALERQAILKAMQRASGVKASAAELLGISRPTLDRKLDELGLSFSKSFGDGR